MEANKNATLLDLAARSLTAALPGRGDDANDVSVTADGLLLASGPGGRTIVAEAVDGSSRSAVLEAWRQLRDYAAAAGAVPVLVLPRLTPSLLELVDREGLNWVDLAGNARIDAPPMLIWVEGRRDPHPRLREGVNPFAGRSLNLVRVLFSDPKRRWRQKEVVAKSGLSQSRASKVLSALEDRGLVRRDDDGAFRVIDPGDLLDAWADASDYRRYEIVPVHLTGEGIALARDLDARLEEADIIHWFTGLPAAWAYDNFARFRLVSVFLSADPAIVARHLGLRHTDRGANVHLIAAGEQRLEIGQSQPNGLPCVQPAQVYVDLLGLPERAAEAAEHLRPLVLSGRGATAE